MAPKKQSSAEPEGSAPLPPHPSWWADCTYGVINLARWWDGRVWSKPAHTSWSAEQAAAVATQPSEHPPKVWGYLVPRRQRGEPAMHLSGLNVDRHGWPTAEQDQDFLLGSEIEKINRVVERIRRLRADVEGVGSHRAAVRRAMRPYLQNAAGYAARAKNVLLCGSAEECEHELVKADYFLEAAKRPQALAAKDAAAHGQNFMGRKVGSFEPLKRLLMKVIPNVDISGRVPVLDVWAACKREPKSMLNGLDFVEDRSGQPDHVWVPNEGPRSFKRFRKAVSEIRRRQGIPR